MPCNATGGGGVTDGHSASWISAAEVREPWSTRFPGPPSTLLPTISDWNIFRVLRGKQGSGHNNTASGNGYSPIVKPVRLRVWPDKRAAQLTLRHDAAPLSRGAGPGDTPVIRPVLRACDPAAAFFTFRCGTVCRAGRNRLNVPERPVLIPRQTKSLPSPSTARR